MRDESEADGKQGTVPHERIRHGERVLVAREKIDDTDNEIVAIPMALDRLDLTEAVVSIDGIGTRVNIAQKIVEGVCTAEPVPDQIG